MQQFQAGDWYWIVGDDQTKLYSTKKDAYVTADDKDYLAWRDFGNAPSSMPTEQALVEFITLNYPFLVCELPIALIAYANTAQWAIATGGHVLQIGGKSVPFSTTTDSMSLMSGKVARLSQPNPPTIINWQTGAATFTPIAAADFAVAATAIADWVQSTFDLLPGIFAKIASGQITTREEIDAALTA